MSARDREALVLLARLDDQPDDDALYAELAEWLGRSSSHSASWNRALDLAAAIETAVPSVLTDRDDQASAAVHVAGNVVPLRPTGPVRYAIRRHWRAAGAIAAAACLGLAILPGALLHLRAQEITGTGEVRQVMLEDGTRVHLAPGSAVSFEEKGAQRSAHLLRGRAYFDVAHDAARPFRVLAGDTKVTVLGTAFEVNDLPVGASVAVRRGAVLVNYGQGTAMVLHKGETSTLAVDGVVERGAVRPDRIAGWMDGRMFVKDRPVGEVLDALRPWYGGYIIAHGPGLSRQRITGVYDLRNPEAALAAIGKVHPLRVRRLAPWLKIVWVD